MPKVYITEPKARKRYHCDANCGQMIDVGEFYVNIKVNDDGEWICKRAHANCYWLAEEMLSLFDYDELEDFAEEAKRQGYEYEPETHTWWESPECANL